MLEVTETAIENMKEYLRDQKIESAIRIVMTSGGCSGPGLGLAIDETKENDLTFEQDGVNFLVEKGLSETCGSVKVDFITSGSGCGGSGGGFTISSEKPLPSAGGGCSSCCGSCS